MAIINGTLESWDGSNFFANYSKRGESA